MDKELILEQHIHGAFGVDFNKCSEEDLLWVAEKLCEHNIAAFFPTLVTDSVSNINRQIIATVNSIGKLKTTVTKERILSINPSANVMTYDTFILPETINSINFSNVDFIPVIKVESSDFAIRYTSGLNEGDVLHMAADDFGTLSINTH